MRVDVHFACNDPDNGLFAGRAGTAAVTWAGVLCELELDPFGGVKFTELGNAIRIHRQNFPIVASKDWVGNWCWNAYRFEYPVYRRLIRTLAKHGWKCTGGLCRWSNAYDALAERMHKMEAVDG